MQAQNLNSSTRRVSVTGTSKSFALDAATTGKTEAIIHNFGTEAGLFVAGQGSAATAVFPTSDGPAFIGKRIAAGSIQTYQLPVGTTHISYITGGGTIDCDVSVGFGV